MSGPFQPMLAAVDRGGEPASRTHRDGGIELARWLGAIGILWFHAHVPGEQIGYAALPMFVLLLIHYGIDRPWRARAVRLMRPWLIWSAIYLVAKLADVLLRGTDPGEELALWMLLTGTSLHLWFLPFCTLFLLVAVPLRGWLLLVVAVPASIAALWAANAAALPIPFAQWVFVLPAACMALVMGRLPRPEWFAAAFLAGCAMAWAMGWTQAAPHLLGAGLVVLGLWRLRLPSSTLTDGLSRLAFGIYLIHPLVMAVVLALGIRGVPMALTVLVLSNLATIAMLRLTPWLIR